MIAAVSSDLIQSEIALRTVSTQRHHPSRKMVDKGLEQVEQKNKVSQNLHKNRLPFNNWLIFGAVCLLIIIVPRSAARDEAIAYVRAANAAHRI